MDTFWVALRIPILHIKDAEHAVHADGKEVSVVVGDAEASDGGGVSLNLSSFLEGQLPDLDCARVWHLTLLTDTGEQDLARVVDHELRDVVFEIGQLGHGV